MNSALRAFTIAYGSLTGFVVLGHTLLRLKKKQPVNKQLPTISVIVAARNEEKTIGALLESLEKQDYPKDLLSFYIVDDDSEDGTAEIIKAKCNENPLFHYVTPDMDSPLKSPKKRAIDTAIRMSKSEWIISTDADCTPGERWIRTMSQYMGERVGSVVGYPSRIGRYSLYHLAAMGESWAAGILSAAAIGLSAPFNAFGGNFAFRRKLYLDLGGYGRFGKVASGDDDLFLQRISLKTDKEIAFATHPDSFVTTLLEDDYNLFRTKSRHLSSGTHYSPGWLIMGIVANFMLMGLSLLSILAALNIVKKDAILKAWRNKWLFDIMMAASGLTIIRDFRKSFYALFAMSAAPFAFWILWPKALFGNVQWKGRSFTRGVAE